MRDIVFVSMENWDDMWRRNQFLCAQFTRQFPSMRILFVGLPRDISYSLRSGQFKDLSAPNPLHPPGFPNITICRPLKFLPISLSVGRQYNDWLFRRTVRGAMRELNMQKPILWLNPHYAAHMAGRMGESQVIYDITDDWTELTQSPFLKRLTIEQDAQLCRRADHVIVCSQRLFESKQSLAANLHLIPNGVDADHYRTVADKNLPLPSATSNWPKPVLGYTGTIHPDRVDVDLLERLARGLRQGSIALVGPNMLSESQRRQLLNCGNVFFQPPVPYAEIPSYMRAFDICITPHLVTPFTASLNPIKLWEYLAAGKPIISTPVAGFTDFPEHVYLAADAPAFLAAIPQALAEPAAHRAARQAQVAHHSWQARVEQITAILESRPAQSHPLEQVLHA